MRDEDLPESSNIEDRRGEEGSFGGGGGGGFGIPGGRGGLGIGTILVLGVVGYALGIDPRVLIGGAEILTGGGGGGGYEQPAEPTRQRQTGAPTDASGRFVARVLGSTEQVWTAVFAQDGKTYTAPTLVLYEGQTDARCGGQAQSAMGPFYCPVDRKVYLDTAFFREIETRFQGCSGAACRFSQAYVIAHEVGHHVQNLLGILPRVERQQQAANGRAQSNHLQVQVELQADCLAGVWANRENATLQGQGKPAFIESGDVEAALRTAAAIGDDTLQRSAGRQVVPDSFTHGSSAQRQRWFTNGFKGGKVTNCNTFDAGDQL